MSLLKTFLIPKDHVSHQILMNHFHHKMLNFALTDIIRNHANVLLLNLISLFMNQQKSLSSIVSTLILSFHNVVCSLSIEVDKQYYTSAITPFFPVSEWKEIEWGTMFAKVSYMILDDDIWGDLKNMFTSSKSLVCLFVREQAFSPSALQWTWKKLF